MKSRISKAAAIATVAATLSAASVSLSTAGLGELPYRSPHQSQVSGLGELPTRVQAARSMKSIRSSSMDGLLGTLRRLIALS